MSDGAAPPASRGSPQGAEKEANKPPSPKPDQEVAPPLKDKPEERDGRKPLRRMGASKPPPPQPGKAKNVVLSGEAMKEMQKQAKATREERRLQGKAKNVVLSGEAMKEMQKQAKATREERRLQL
uniref:Uncharacterized protein n=1 Tax=Branchiostoma floridae TaxID=7739 RepID=C3ZNR6_BRAFL|eukprot:XP_002589787.1 hypothetical protein BRAFLDRAFT_90468 [Branchiostoma floridae]